MWGYTKEVVSRPHIKEKRAYWRKSFVIIYMTSLWGN